MAFALVFAALALPSLVPTSSFSEDGDFQNLGGTLFAFFFAGGFTRADSFVFAFLVLSCVPFVELRRQSRRTEVAPLGERRAATEVVCFGGKGAASCKVEPWVGWLVI